MTLRCTTWMMLSLAFVAMSTSYAQAGLLSFGDNPTVMKNLSFASEGELSKESPPVEQYFHAQIDLCEPGGVSAPNTQLTSSNAGIGFVNSEMLAGISKSQIVTKLNLTTIYCLPSPLADRLFRPPENVEFQIQINL